MSTNEYCSYCNQRQAIGVDFDGATICQECTDPRYTPEALDAFDHWYRGVGFLFTDDEEAALAAYIAGRASALVEVTD